MECAICLKPLKSGEETGSAHTLGHCQHHFHQKCLADWRKVNSSCPICRHPIPPTRSNATRKEDTAVAASQAAVDDMPKDINAALENLKKLRQQPTVIKRTCNRSQQCVHSDRVATAEQGCRQPQMQCSNVRAVSLPESEESRQARVTKFYQDKAWVDEEMKRMMDQLALSEQLVMTETYLRQVARSGENVARSRFKQLLRSRFKEQSEKMAQEQRSRLNSNTGREQQASRPPSIQPDETEVRRQEQEVQAQGFRHTLTESVQFNRRLQHSVQSNESIMQQPSKGSVPQKESSPVDRARDRRPQDVSSMPATSQPLDANPLPSVLSRLGN